MELPPLALGMPQGLPLLPVYGPPPDYILPGTYNPQIQPPHFAPQLNLAPQPIFATQHHLAPPLTYISQQPIFNPPPVANFREVVTPPPSFNLHHSLNGPTFCPAPLQLPIAPPSRSCRPCPPLVGPDQFHSHRLPQPHPYKQPHHHPYKLAQPQTCNSAARTYQPPPRTPPSRRTPGSHRLPPKPTEPRIRNPAPEPKLPATWAIPTSSSQQLSYTSVGIPTQPPSNFTTPARASRQLLYTTGGKLVPPQSCTAGPRPVQPQTYAQAQTYTPAPTPLKRDFQTSGIDSLHHCGYTTTPHGASEFRTLDQRALQRGSFSDIPHGLPSFHTLETKPPHVHTYPETPAKGVGGYHDPQSSTSLSHTFPRTPGHNPPALVPVPSEHNQYIVPLSPVMPPSRKRRTRMATANNPMPPPPPRPIAPCTNGVCHFHRLHCGHVVKTSLNTAPTVCATNCQSQPEANAGDSWGPAPFACPVCIAKALNMLWKMDIVNLKKQFPTLSLDAYALWVRQNYNSAWEMRRQIRINRWIPGARDCGQLSVRERRMVQWLHGEEKAPYQIEEFRRVYERREVHENFWGMTYRDTTTDDVDYEAEPGTVYQSVEKPGIHYPAEWYGGP